ncbi:MAG: hypothetical protein QM751_06130 [Paludibacteraceae bacterium]
MKLLRLEYIIGLLNTAFLTELFTVDFTKQVLLLVLQIILTILTRFTFDKVKRKIEQKKNETLSNHVRANKKTD